METRNERRTPFIAVHPGNVIKDELQERGVRQSDFAIMIGMQKSHLNEIIKGKRNITKSVADKLESALGIPSIAWMNMQNNYDYDVKVIERRDEEESKLLQIEKMIKESFNLNELYKRFSIECYRVTQRFKELSEELGISVTNLQMSQYTAVGFFKRSDKCKIDERNLRTWILIANSTARKTVTSGIYEKGNGEKAAKEISGMANSKNISVSLIKECLSNFGIGYDSEKCLPQTPVDAYSTMTESHPAIIATYRHNDMDKLAFDIIHELCHIDRHMNDKSCSYVSVDGSAYSEDSIEKEANKFAQDMLIDPNTWKKIMSIGAKKLNSYVVINSVAKEAKKYGISPTIAIARYKHDTEFYKVKAERPPKIIY